MKRICLAIATVAASFAASAQDVGVSVHVNQPGIYGRIDIGNVPQPPVLVYPQPVVIVQSPVAVHQRPIYLHVPPGHERNWGKHCAKYNACGQPVYFVREDWYQQHYRPIVVRERQRTVIVRERDRDDDDRGRHEGRRHKHDKDKHHGKGRGKGHGKHDD